MEGVLLLMNSKWDEAEEIHNKVEKEWNRSYWWSIRLYHRHSLFLSMARALSTPFLIAAGLKFIHDVSQLIQPVMLEKILLILEDSDAGPSDGYYYTAILLLTCVVESFTRQHYFFLCNRTGRGFRSSCITMM